MTEQILYQSVQPQNELSNELRSVIRDNVLQFYVQSSAQQQEEGITALYERLSQEDKADGESNSIANQKRILERYCRDHGITAYRHYDEDDGYSGTNFNRPGFQRMLADIKAGKIKRVIVKDMSRFGRDYLQVGMYTDVLFPDFGVHFIAVNDGVDSTRGENEFTAIRNVFNEMYARDTSKKIRATWQSKGKSGEHLTTIPPYGYIKDPENKKKWIVDEEAAAIVQKIFSLCVDGLGPTQIAKWLRQHQILNPTAYAREKGQPCTNKPSSDPYKWTNETVSRMLERVDYLGHTVNFKTTKQSYKSKKKLWNDPAEWVIFENHHEGIVTKEEYETVQMLLAKDTRIAPGENRLYLFGGLLSCGDCGSNLIRRTNSYKGEKTVFYICSSYNKKKDQCSRHSIREDVLIQLVMDSLKIYSKMTDAIRSAMEYLKENSLDTQTLIQHDDQILELRNKVNKYYKLLHSLSGNLASGVISRDDYALLRERYQTEIKSLESNIEKQEEYMENLLENKLLCEEWVNTFLEKPSLGDLDRDMLLQYVEKINVFEGKKIEIVYRFQDELVTAARLAEQIGKTKQEVAV